MLGGSFGPARSHKTFRFPRRPFISYSFESPETKDNVLASLPPSVKPFVPQKQLPSADLPYPVSPQMWHFRRSIDYSITANRAVLDLASKHREDFLFNIYRMGRNSIERGSRDSWTVTPKRIAAVQAALGKTGEQQDGRGRFGGAPPKYYEMLRDPARRDPRGYIIPAEQPDFLTATKFVNALIKTGITIHRATSPFHVAGKSYAAGSYVVKTAQAFRPHILDMFEPQDHPDDIPYPGGPPRPPYDNAGYTLAYQMGVEFDRILEGFDGPFEKVTGFAKPPAGKVIESHRAAGYLLSHRVNDSFIAINRLLATDEEVYWLKKPLGANGKTYETGTIFIPAKSSTSPTLQKLASELGLNFDAVSARPAGEAFKLRPARVGLWDRYGGSMPSGWVRWLFERYEFPFEVVFPPALDAGNLINKFDVLIFVTGGIGTGTETGSESPRFDPAPDPARIPAEYRNRLGTVTVSNTVPQLRRFLEDGGTVLAIGSSTVLGYHAGLPIMNALTERLPDGAEKQLSRERFYVPGSILRVRVDTANPLAYGMGDTADVFFDNSPVFRLRPDAGLKSVRPVSWFDTKTPLRSGWAWGEGYLENGVTVIDAAVGKGKLFLFGPEITFRGQPHGTFKFLFNGIYYGRAESVVLP